MAFRVEVEPQALEDLVAIAEHIKEHSFETAERWFNGVMRAIWRLQESPSRCPVTSESEDLGQEVRLLLHGRRNQSYKIYFTIHHETPSTGTVRVLHVRHWARRPLTGDEFENLMNEPRGEDQE